VVLRDSTCALKDDWTLWCWGDNREGELGDGSYEKRVEPTRAIAPERFRMVAAAAHHVCGVTLDDRLLCWGRNYEGQLGNGQPPSTKPVNYAAAQNMVRQFTGFRALALGYSSTLVALENGELYASGDLTLGMRGFKSSPQSTPQKIPMPGSVVEVAAHATHRCALLSDDSVWCWGKGDGFELGNGHDENHAEPVRVALPK
jgi:alpha-tubulin suppressor-like RCC1 family protein